MKTDTFNALAELILLLEPEELAVVKKFAEEIINIIKETVEAKD